MSDLGTGIRVADPLEEKGNVKISIHSFVFDGRDQVDTIYDDTGWIKYFDKP